jgi:8-oxo-dGTP pyrophosphatase MutT (NUDIX family)
VTWAARLSVRLPRAVPSPSVGFPNAAVAVVLHDPGDGPRVLLMQRAERTGDPWSGHVALPGGRVDALDADLLATATRETREELGVDLSGARWVGHLPAMSPLAAGAAVVVTPFLFIAELPVEPVCGPEAVAAFWLPLDAAARGSFDTTFVHPRTQSAFPAWSFEGRIVWGLTWRILSAVIQEAGVSR